MALRESLLHAALSGELSAEPPRLGKTGLREAVRVEQAGYTVLFVVDASDSMGTVSRLSAARSAALHLLGQAYLRRLKVGMIIFRGDSAYTLLEPTSSISLVRRRMSSLEVGDATPLAAGLIHADATARRILAADGSGTVLCAVLTDGEANVPYRRGRRSEEELAELAPTLHHRDISYLFLDTSPGRPNSLMRRLAELSGGRYLHLAPDSGEDLLQHLEA